jgi:glycosyltransferase involved in cell wall biosynthesis
MRIGHVGNIAQNAFLNAKFQRRLGVQADSFDLGGGNPMWVPWWEETDVDPTQVSPAWYDWVSVAEATGWRRPPWAKIMSLDCGSRAWYDTQEAYQDDLCRLLPGALELSERGQREEQRRLVAEALSLGRLSEEEAIRSAPALEGFPQCRAIRELAAPYDLVVLYGPYASYGCVLPRAKKYITFEHSTMRLVPWLDKPEYHSLAAAYRHADANVITNADCGEAAWCLGLSNCTFIPHPLDDDQFAPAVTDSEADREAQELASRLRSDVPGGAELIFFAPARQSRSARTGAKRNDRIFYAYARYCEEQERLGLPRAILMAGAWGNGPDVTASDTLHREIGLRGRVVWLPQQPKRRMAALYRASDVVLDQFSEQVGSFGTVTAEALSSGKPVITYVERSAHEWCLPELGGSLPPVCNARTADDIFEQLCLLAGDPARRAWYGQEARAWVVANHGWRSTTARHLALYARVLDVPVEALTTQSEQQEEPATAPSSEQGIGALALELAAGG